MLSKCYMHEKVFSLIERNMISCYCLFQDMVNLLLTGRAVSNVFNDTVELDSGEGAVTVLKGIQSRSNVGLLSLFEHYKSCQVPVFSSIRIISICKMLIWTLALLLKFWSLL